jgi:hypothetical protein
MRLVRRNRDHEQPPSMVSKVGYLLRPASATRVVGELYFLLHHPGLCLGVGKIPVVSGESRVVLRAIQND